MYVLLIVFLNLSVWMGFRYRFEVEVQVCTGLGRHFKDEVWVMGHFINFSVLNIVITVCVLLN